MHWNHRIVDMSHENGGDPWFEIKEVYYEKKTITGYTNICTGCESVEGLIECLERMLKDIQGKKVINGLTQLEI